jgi:hypothetical protein
LTGAAPSGSTAPLRAQWMKSVYAGSAPAPRASAAIWPRWYAECTTTWVTMSPIVLVHGSPFELT